MGILSGVRLFEHVSLLYEGLDDLVQHGEAFVRDGIVRDEPVLVLMPQAHVDALRDALGRDATSVRFGDMQQIGRNPSAIISVWRDFVAEHAHRRVRGIGEPIWHGRSVEELLECHRHEALINLAFQEASATILCPYDLTTLDPDVIAESYRTHPYVITPRGREDSEQAMTFTEIARPVTDSLPEPETTPAVFGFGGPAISEVRTFVAKQAGIAGLPQDRIDELVVAVNEVATNTVRYGGARGLVRTWVQDGRFIVEVRDDGFIDNALAGRLRPSAGAEGGYGLWLVNQLCDFVQLRSSQDGSIVRLHMRIG
ncbi:MAG TPA: sensor histidine kinase [Vitreimonas sp.]|nr:sensor histidine kinase [Vitreimonas sp.]